jgi:coenzyme F420-reducing hydrogenase beta subunit
MRIRYVLGGIKTFCSFCRDRNADREFLSIGAPVTPGSSKWSTVQICESCLEALQRLMKGEDTFEA